MTDRKPGELSDGELLALSRAAFAVEYDPAEVRAQKRA
jgi:hypothetical protein